ncbi:MAG: UDP-N-acetylmuramate dehydrogenase [Oscillospiraceae bacterium]|nr:UDP-N-acetylmuramate dehydrogenase [Oscillospiraceae bacterium]
MKEKLKQLCEQWKTELLENVRLSEHTTFQIGGCADYWAEVASTGALSNLIKFCQAEGLPFFVMGKGSNILASDQGFRGLILHIGKGFSDMYDDGAEITYEAGMSLIRAAKIAESKSLSGMEGLSGIPGTIGGALYMNAGAYGYEMSQIVTGCTYMDMDGKMRTMEAEELELSYRHSWFTDHPGIILSVTVKLTPGDKSEITTRMLDFLHKRNDMQPLNFPTAGSTFKRPEGNYASALIDECGLKGLCIGDAQVSPKHAGFIINRGRATCADVLKLCGHVQNTVKEKTGYELELEPILLGEQTGA